MLQLGFDPGRDKCGLAILDTTGNIIVHEVVNSEQAVFTIKNWCHVYAIDQIVMGNQTTSKTWQDTLKANFPEIPITMVDERNSTLEARERYWQLYPPRGLWRLVPKGMRIPPRPIDDIVAVLLVERACQSEG
ncbi:MAG: resolvase [Cyanobacteria bacterium SW_9_44_58]|nr:MAG: resolvase [Cyanobacteria bacterium SW_9_44_58]